MPYNTELAFTRSGRRWGVAWLGKYRDPRAINRTLVTSVLYVSAAHLDARPLASSPLKIAKLEGQTRFRINTALAGFSVVYAAADGSHRCVRIDVKGSRPVLGPAPCRFSGPILRNGDDSSDWAIAFDRGNAYALTRSDGLAIVASSDARGQRPHLTLPDTKHLKGTRADLLLDRGGLAVIWVDPSRCSAASKTCEPFVYAHRPAKGRRWQVSPLSISAPRSGRHEVQLTRGAKGAFALIRAGAALVKVPIDEISHLPKSPTTLLDIAEHRAPKLTLGFTLSATVISCDQGHCLASFPAGRGRSYLFSTQRGLLVRGNLATRVRCSGGACLSEVEAGAVKRLELRTLPTPR